MFSEIGHLATVQMPYPTVDPSQVQDRKCVILTTDTKWWQSAHVILLGA